MSDQMAPDTSPGEVSNNGVRRVNNVPMYLLGAIVGMFVLVMALVANDRAAQQNEFDPGAKEKAGNTSMYANEIAGEATAGIIEPAKPLIVPDMPEAAPVMIAKPENLDAPPAPPPPMQDDEAMRIRMAKLQQLEEAVKAKTGVQVGAPRSSGSTAAPQTRQDVLAQIAAAQQQINAQRDSNPTAAYQQRLAQIRANTSAAGSGAGAGPLLSAPAENTLGQFAGANNGGASNSDRWMLDSKLEAPRTPYELRAGFVVPATLISGINSDLPGQIMAQVAQNVYDTPTGKHLLIPLGSRLVGSYSSDVKYGQARVLVAWQRIVFPDGKAMDIGAMPGADSAGYAGFNDQANNHYFRLFASAILMSGVTAGITYSQRQNQTQSVGSSPTASSALSEALGQQLGQVTAQMVAKNLSISPTLEIRPGYRFNVVVTKDMTFSKPYRSFDY